MYTTAAQLERLSLPGTTASGIASASQLVDATPYVALRTDTTAAPCNLILLSLVRPTPEVRAIVGRTPLVAEEYPVLAGIWDNDDDAIFDTV